jgi:hypothetical protein
MTNSIRKIISLEQKNKLEALANTSFLNTDKFVPQQQTKLKSCAHFTDTECYFKYTACKIKEKLRKIFWNVK